MQGTTTNTRRGARAVIAAAVLTNACGGADPAAGADASADVSADAGCVHCTPSCPSPDEAPLRLPDGGATCTRVGAAAGAAVGAWPDATNAPAPVVYVGPAGGPRTPSGEAPIADLAAALARTPRPGTVLVAAGTYDLAGTLRVTSPVVIRGAGPGRTTLVGPAGADAVVVAAEGGGAVEASLQGLAVSFDGRDGAAAGVRVVGAGAVANLRDVEVARASEGVRAEGGATVCAEGLTVRDAARVGVTLTDGSHGYLRNAAVRGGAGVGVLARRSHLAFDTGLVADNGRDGVVLSGTASGDACSGAVTECAPSPACAGFRHEQTCAASLRIPARAGAPAVPPEGRCRSVSVLSNVAVVRNGVTGLRAERTAPTAEEAADPARRDRVLAAPGPHVRATHLVVAGTRQPAGLVGGYGVYAGPTSNVSLDPDIASDAERGLGSLIADNAGAGVLVDGDPFRPGGGGFVVGDVAIPEGLVRAGTLSMAGALVGSNRGPGAFVQHRAVLERVAYSAFADNAFIGLGVSSGSLAQGFCDTFTATRAGTFPGLAAPVGDGVSLADVTARPEPHWRAATYAPRFADSAFSGNAGFGFLAVGGEAVTFEAHAAGNRGADNRYGVGLYEGARVTGDASAIRGRSPAPSAAPVTARDYMQRGG